VKNEATIVDSSLKRLPVFPLPDVQLFPGAILPLHVFEPRYLELVDNVLERVDNSIAIATLRPGYESEYQGRPPIYGIMGVGSVIAAERKTDGRWNLLVRGKLRARMVEEFPEKHAFREISVERFEDTNLDLADPLEERLRSMINQLSDHSDGAREALQLILSQSNNGAELTNLLGAHACSDSALRRRMLECPNVETRLRMACQHMGRVLLEVLEAPAGGRETLH
jgi:Lon protease-like protein